jgi:predicted enzyme related to lactoylglutathione lyase
MTTVSAPTPGSFCWIELATSDQPAAKNFYQHLFGWTATDNPMGPGEIYTIFQLKERDSAAAYTLRPDQRQRGVPVHWSLYIAVADCDESAKRAAELGGTVLMPPFDVMSAGRMAVIHDPAGAVVSLWQAKQHSGVLVQNEEGAFCWADLLTRDREKAVAFYTALLGWTIEKEGDGYYHIKNGEHHIGGMPPSQSLPPGTHTHWSIYFHTEDCVAKTSQAKALGARIYMPNMKIEGVGTMSVVEDPQGATFCLFEKARA